MDLIRTEEEYKRLTAYGLRTEEALLKIREALFDKDYLLSVMREEVKRLEQNAEEIIQKGLKSAEDTRKRLNLVAQEIEDFKNEETDFLYGEFIEEINTREYHENRIEEDKQTYARLLDQIENKGIMQTDVYRDYVLFATSTEAEEKPSTDMIKNLFATLKDNFYAGFDYFIGTAFINDFSRRLLREEDMHINDVFPASAKISDRLSEIHELLIEMLENAPVPMSINTDLKPFKRAYYRYSDTAEYTLNNLAYALIHSPINEINSILKNEAIDFRGTEEAKENIRALTPLEKRVLDIIIGFYKNGKELFTNGQIAGEIYGQEKRKEGNEYFRPTLNQLAEIDKAIEKLRRTMIEIKGTTGTEKDAFYNSRNPFISVLNVGKRNEETNIQMYKFTSAPFYYTYNERTNGMYIPYNRSTITKEIAGFKKTPKNTDLRIYLQETISNIILGYERPYISLEDIYSRYGADTRKQKQDVREKTEDILKSLKSEYRFAFKPDKKGIKYAGFEIVKIRA